MQMKEGIMSYCQKMGIEKAVANALHRCKLCGDYNFDTVKYMFHALFII